jgi:hypothetical protein
MKPSDYEDEVILLLEGLTALVKAIKKLRTFIEKIRARPP